MIFILEIIGSTMGYVMRSQVAMVAKNKMMETMSNYNDSKEIQYVWDNLQRDVICNYIELSLAFNILYAIEEISLK